MRRARSGVRILVVDDSEEFLAGASAWVLARPGLELAGTATGGEPAVAAAARLRPDLVLMDVAMPGMDGFEATRRIKGSGAAPLVVMLSFHDTRAVRDEAWSAGADGFVSKAELADELPRVIEKLLTGKGAGGEDGPQDAARPGGRRPKAERPAGPPIEPGAERRSGVSPWIRPRGVATQEREPRGALAPRNTGRRIARFALRAIWGTKEDRMSMQRILKWSGVAAMAVALASTATFAGGKTEFVRMGTIGMTPFSLSADGSVAVGTAYFGTPGFYWTESDGVVTIGGGCGAGYFKVSGDGNTIIGCILDENGKQNAAKWIGGENYQILAPVAGAVSCDAGLTSAWDVDYYGDTAVGLGYLPQQCRAHAVSWDVRSGAPATDLGALFPNTYSRANAISGDGHTIAGWQDSVFGERQGAKWVDGVESYVLTDAGEHVGEVFWVNYDGTAMCGANYPYGSSDAWVWTAKGGFTDINTGPIFSTSVSAVQASDDGSVVVGIARNQNGVAKGWIFHHNKLIWATDYLAKRLAPGWTVWAMSAVSADGSTLAGYGANPNGQVEGFVIKNFK